MSRLDAFKGFVGDLARPFAIWSTACSAAIATVRIAWQGEHFVEAAAFIGAVYTGVGALYVGKAWERNAETKHLAQVEIAKAATSGSPSPTSTDLSTSSMSMSVQHGPHADDDGTLPPDQRVKP